MSLAQPTTQDKPQNLHDMAQNLQDYVQQAAQQGTDFYQVERAILDHALQMGRLATDTFLALQGDGDLGETIPTDDGQTLHRSEQPQPRSLRTVFGEHSFEAYTYAPGPKKKIALRPIDARLNLPLGKASYLFEEFSQYFCIEQAFGQAANALETVLGQSLSVDTLQRINRQVGEQAQPFLERLPVPDKESEGELLILTADGKGVPMIREQPQKTPAGGPKPHRPHDRRMATVACVYSVDRHPRTAEEVRDALFRVAPEAQAASSHQRPKPCHKRMNAFFSQVEDEGTEDELLIRSGIRAWGWIDSQVETRCVEDQVLVRICDGQESLWSDAELCLEVEAADRPKTEVVDVLDIIHVCSYVWKVAGVLYEGESSLAAEFVSDRLLRILRGEVKGVISGIRRMSSQRELIGSGRKEVLGACGYLENNLGRMRYGEYLAKGYPIASGVIEGACRHLVKDRMERTGMRWCETSAESMLFVRAVQASDLWQEFQSHRQSCEQERVHPHRALVGGYTPTGGLAA